MDRQKAQLVAIFCICLIVNTTFVSAVSISHSPGSDNTIDGNAATINWTTDELADSTVNYGDTTAVSQSEQDNDLGTEHSIVLTNLLYDTLYYYGLVSENLTGNLTVDDNYGNYYTFRTGEEVEEVNDTEDAITPGSYTLQADIPEMANRKSISFKGTTAPNSFIYLYINPAPGQETSSGYNRFTTSDANGNFSFLSAVLSQDNNTLVLRSVDPDNQQVIVSYNVRIDSVPPVVNITPNPLPSFANSTSLNVAGTVNEPCTITYTINNVTNDIQSENEFSFSLNLESDKVNSVLIEVVDIAGNVVDFSQDIYVDAEAPQFLETNLDQLSPSYTQEVTIKGKISEPGATVIVYVNDQASVTDAWTSSFVDNLKKFGRIIAGDTDYITTTDSEGFFSVDVLLTIDLQQEQNDPLDIDGLNTSFGGETNYLGRTIRRTGSSYDPEYEWDNDIKIVVIDRVGLTEELEGVITYARCGSGSDWNIKISEVSPGVVTPEHLRLGIAQFGFRVDLEWQGAGEENEIVMSQSPIIRTYQLSQERRDQYVIDPQELVGSHGPQSQWSDDLKTGYVFVHLNAYNYTQPDVEDLNIQNLTLHIPMQIELHYNYPWFGQQAEGTQKQCWDTNLLLDVQVPPDTVPKWLLNASIYLINNTLFAIEKILKPLQKISVVVFLTCISSWVVYFVTFTQERLACAAVAKDDFGNCDKEKEQEESLCEQCDAAVQSRKKVEELMHWVCDRMFCPSVPTVSRFMQTHKVESCRDKSVRDFNEKNSQEVKTSATADPCIKDYVQQWEGACVFEDEYELSRCYELGAESGACGGTFKQALNKASDFCERKENPEGRYVNYQGQTFVRGEESWCIGEEVERGRVDRQTGRVEEETREDLIQNVDPNKCNFRVHGSSNTIYDPRDFSSAEALDRSSDARYNYGEGADTETVYYRNLNSGAIGSDESVSPYGRNAVISNTGQIYVYKGDEWVPSDPTDSTHFNDWEPFTEDTYDRNTGEKYSNIQTDEQRRGFQPMRAPDEVERDLISYRPYILKPASSFPRAIQCVCLPAVTGYLTLWKNVLEQVKLCFQSVMVTGNPNTGLCRAVLTVYVCDLIFDAIRCFVNKYSDVETEKPSSIGGFMKAVAGAGKDVQSSITGRYGETALYNTMFNERKVIHQICLAAFTGDWDIDLEGMLSGAGAIPIKSEGFLYPHTRRFMTSNPLNYGRTTYIYHLGVGLIAGADLTYKIELVCSNDMTCDPSDNYPSGACDCYRRGQEETFLVTNYLGFGTGTSGVGQLEAGQMVGPTDGDIYIPAYDQAIRYDKVRLSWVYVDNEQKTVTELIEKPIRLIGGKPPADCRFDLGSLEYRCSFAIGEKGYAAFGVWPETKKDFYYKNEKIELEFTIDKQSPDYQPNSGDPDTSNPENQIPKYLCWKTYKKNGGGTIKQEECTEIREDGTFSEKSFHALPGITITEDLIMSSVAGAGNCRFAYKGSWPVSSPTCSVSNSGAIKITYDGSKFTYELGTYPNGQFNRLGATGECPISDTTTVSCAGFGFRLHGSDKPPAGTSAIITFESVGNDLVSTECEAITESNPQIWVVDMKLHNAKKRDEDLDLTARNSVMNPSDIVVYNRQKQEAQVEVKVVCSESSEGIITAKCRGLGYLEREPCKCYDENRMSGPSAPCDGGNMYCYNYDDVVPAMCYDGQCGASTSSNGNTVPCDCDGDQLIDKDECRGKYCVAWEINEYPDLLEADAKRVRDGERSLIDGNKCSLDSLETLKQKLGVTW